MYEVAVKTQLSYIVFYIYIYIYIQVIFAHFAQILRFYQKQDINIAKTTNFVVIFRNRIEYAADFGYIMRFQPFLA